MALPLPDEIILDIFTYLTPDPDCLLTNVAQVNSEFLRLSRDSSIWRSFAVPGHWGGKNLVRFLEITDLAKRIIKLDVSTLASSRKFFEVCFLQLLMASQQVLPSVTELVIDKVGREQVSLDGSLKVIPSVFPGLKLLKLTGRVDLLQDLAWLESQMPDLRVEIDNINPCISFFAQINSLHLNVAMLRHIQLSSLIRRYSLELRTLPTDNEPYQAADISLHILCGQDFVTNNCFSSGFQHFLNHLGDRVQTMKLEGWERWDQCVIPQSIRLLANSGKTQNMRKLWVTSSTETDLSRFSSMQYLEPFAPMVSLSELGITTTGLGENDFQIILNACSHLQTLHVLNSDAHCIDSQYGPNLQFPNSLRTLRVSGTMHARSIFERSLQLKQLRNISAYGDETAKELGKLCDELLPDKRIGWRKLQGITLSDCDFQSAAKVMNYLMLVDAPINSIELHQLLVSEKLAFPGRFPKLGTLKLFCDLENISSSLSSEIEGLLQQVSDDSPGIRDVSMSVNFTGITASFPLSLKFLPQALSAMMFLKTFKFEKKHHIELSPAICDYAVIRHEFNERHGKWIRLTLLPSLVELTQCPPAFRYPEGFVGFDS